MADGRLLGWLKSLKSGTPVTHPQECDDEDLQEMTLRGPDFRERLAAFKAQLTRKDVHHES